MAHSRAVVVEIDGEKFIINRGRGKGKGDLPDVIAFGGSYDTGIECPPTQGDECVPGYTERCDSTTGTVWCDPDTPG